MNKIALLTCIVFSAWCTCATAQIYKVVSGTATFSSKGLLEETTATCAALQGGIDLKGGAFTFKLNIKKFTGFNSELQRQHFHENYIESEKFPTALFKGKIVENITALKPGTHTLRAKGNLTMHGITQHLILPLRIVVSKEGHIAAFSNFTLEIEKFGISIPRVVSDKLNKNVDVVVSCSMEKVD
jgi:hypothetical protein